LVFEVAFEGLQRSTRHKSGLAMRFPRISRLRWDKPPREADTLETLETMLARIETGRGEIAAVAATNASTRAGEAEIVLKSARSGDSHG
jgi:DNA ligase-1